MHPVEGTQEQEDQDEEEEAAHVNDITIGGFVAVGGMQNGTQTQVT